MRKYLRLSLLLLGLVIIGVVMNYTKITPDYFAEQVMPNNEIDFYIQDAVISQFNKNGMIDYVLISPKIEHFKLTDITKVNFPNIKSYHNNDEWSITSKQAQILDNNNMIYFINNVLVNKNNELNLVTNSLTLLPNQDYLFSNDITTMQSSNTKVVGNNLNIDLRNGTLRLHDVKTEYAH